MMSRWIGLLIVLFSHNALAKEGEAESPSWIQLSGGLQFISEYNWQYGDGLLYRYPFNNQLVGRLILNARLTLFNQIHLPFQLSWTTHELQYRQPFNQFGASLQLSRWLKLHGGYFSLSFSPLVFGDQRILGGGIELSPRPFYLGFLYGLGRHARLPQAMFPGEYDRWFWAMKVGIRSDNNLTLMLTLMHAIDDSLSLPDTVRLPSMENAAASLTVSLPLTSFLRLNGEVAVAAFTRDLSFPPTSIAASIPQWLFTPRYSSSVDGAANLQLHFTPSPDWSLKLKGEWIGPGYVTLGYTQLLNDIARLTLSPTARLWDARLLLSGSLGIQQNNLIGDKSATTRRLIGAINASAQLSSALSITATYTNYGIRSNHRNDTLRVETISQMLSLTPTVQFQTERIRHNLHLSYSYSEVTDQNLFTAQQQNFRGHSITLAHTMMLPAQWQLTTTAFWSDNKAGDNPTPSMLNLSETIRKSWLNNRLQLLLNIGYGIQTILEQRSTTLFARFNSSYSLDQLGRIALLILWQQSIAPNYRSHLLRASLTYSLRW